jgi:hypothetical protein
MKNKIFIVILSFLMAFAWGCEDYLDVNHDPNVIEEVPDAIVLLPGIQVGLGNQLMGWDFGFGGAYWTQYWTQNYTASQFKQLCEYRETSFSNAYQDLTAGVLIDAEDVKDMTAGDEDQIGLYFVSEALSIFTWQVLTDVWGDVPYFDALQGSEGIESPEFDTQQVIYEDLLSRIDALLEIDLSDAHLDSKFDFIFAGDLNQWHLFANSLKLKLLMRISETSLFNLAEALTFVENNDFLTASALIDGTTYWTDGSEGKRHPMREFEVGGASYLSTNVIACKSFIDYLNVNSDPRIESLFEPTDNGFVGAFFGDFESKQDSDGDGTADDKQDYSTSIIPADLDLIIMSNWEVAFFMAELYVRDGQYAEAGDYYVAGVEYSLSQHGLSDLSIVEENGYAVWENVSSLEEALEVIGMQKWVANANYQHIESFLERNRIKYPAVDDIDIAADRETAWTSFPTGKLTVSVEGRQKTSGNLPASPIYPSSVLTRNTNAPGQKVDLLEKVWWNQRSGK